MRKQTISIVLASAFLAPASWAQSKPAPECRSQQIEKSQISMCRVRGGTSQHDTYTLRIDGAMIFALIDDYAEQVELTHTDSDGSSIKSSKQGEKVVKITGGCLPESEDGVEVARVCNFHWGQYQVVKNQRFEFQ